MDEFPEFRAGREVVFTWGTSNGCAKKAAVRGRGSGVRRKSRESKTEKQKSGDRSQKSEYERQGTEDAGREKGKVERGKGRLRLRGEAKGQNPGVGDQDPR